jgi:hypothetical protein
MCVVLYRYYNIRNRERVEGRLLVFDVLAEEPHRSLILNPDLENFPLKESVHCLVFPL